MLKAPTQDLTERGKEKEENFLNQKVTKEIIEGTKKTREIKQGEEDRFPFIFQFKIKKTGHFLRGCFCLQDDTYIFRC